MVLCVDARGLKKNAHHTFLVFFLVTEAENRTQINYTSLSLTKSLLGKTFQAERGGHVQGVFISVRHLKFIAHLFSDSINAKY